MSIQNKLSLWDRLGLELQRVVSRLLFVFTGPTMSYLVFRGFKLRVKNLRAIRRQYRKLLKQGEGPIIICSNHLTYADSVIQSVFLGSTWSHLFKFKKLAWHLPEKTNFYHNLIWRIACYLGKSIPVIRSGPPKASKKSLMKMQYVLGRGDVISIFPEGTRGRDGRIDTENFSYGVGQMLKKYDKSRALCIYMRAKEGIGFGKFPKRNMDYHFEMEMINPSSEYKGLKKAKDISTQIVMKLKEMENKFFNE